MSNLPEDAPLDRWDMLRQEMRSMIQALNGFTLAGAMDRDINHIASMQEDIDRTTREALVVYWLSRKRGELPQGIA